MRIKNLSGHNLIIDGATLEPTKETVVGEMVFNSQAIFSDIGSVEIITEYSNRSFRCYGNLRAYESKEIKDTNGMPQIIVVNNIPQNLYKNQEVTKSDNITAVN